MAAYDEAQSRMWHLDHDPYNRVPSEPRHYNPARHSYTPATASAAPLDQHRAQSMDAVDTEHWTAGGRNDANGFNGPNGRVPGTRVVEVGGGRLPNVPRPPRAGKRPRSSRNSGHKAAGGGGGGGGEGGGGQAASTSQNDFVYWAPHHHPPRGALALPEDGDDDDDEDDDERQTKAARERKPFLRETDESMGRKCRDCMTRVPYATLIATLMCCVGVGVFCGTMYRGTTLTLRLFDDVFRLRIKWDQEYRVEPVQLTFMVVGAGMGGLGLMILFVGCLSTGDTRNKVYRTWRGRVGGRISCAIFMGITYLLSLAWLLMFAALIIVTLLYTLAWFQCMNVPQNECIDYNQFSFMFPAGTPEEDKRVCSGERKLFCKDYVNNAEIMFILATVSAFLVILSLVHYLMCLAANYAHIKDQEKFMDLQEIQFLHESEMSTLPKDRF